MGKCAKCGNEIQSGLYCEGCQKVLYYRTQNEKSNNKTEREDTFGDPQRDEILRKLQREWNDHERQRNNYERPHNDPDAKKNLLFSLLIILAVIASAYLLFNLIIEVYFVFKFPNDILKILG